jgi:hypothetical protein
MAAPIDARNLSKNFGRVTALSGFNLVAEHG